MSDFENHRILKGKLSEQSIKGSRLRSLNSLNISLYVKSIDVFDTSDNIAQSAQLLISKAKVAIDESKV